MVFAIHWHESAMDLHVFPILIPPPASLPIPSLWVFPLVSCIQPGLKPAYLNESIELEKQFKTPNQPWLVPWGLYSEYFNRSTIPFIIHSFRAIWRGVSRVKCKEIGRYGTLQMIEIEKYEIEMCYTNCPSCWSQWVNNLPLCKEQCLIFLV